MTGDIDAVKVKYITNSDEQFFVNITYPSGREETLAWPRGYGDTTYMYQHILKELGHTIKFVK